MLPNKIKSNIDSNPEPSDKRGHLGFSSLGEECKRKLWFNFRWAKESSFPARVLRIFKLGHVIEDIVIDDLRRAGYEIETEKNGQQFHFGTFGGLLSGSIDGIILLENEWYILEVKSYNKKRFQYLEKNGVEKSDPHYFSQVQLYMGASELKTCCFIAYCKDNSEYYIEILQFDSAEYQKLIEKGINIIESMTPPTKEYNRRDHYKCKMCQYIDICWHNEPIRKTCRSCQFGKPDTERGSWVCNLKKECRDYDDQEKACKNYSSIF